MTICRHVAATLLPASSAVTRSLQRVARVDSLSGGLDRAQQRFTPRPDDIFIASYPKSGATLMQMMLYQLTTDGDMDFPHIACVSPLLDDALRSGESLGDFPSPRLLKTHARRDLIEHFTNAGRWVYVIRHPGDVLVSAYYQMVMQMGREVRFEPFLERAYMDFHPWGSWFDHARSWWPHRNDANILLLAFGDLTSDIRSAIERVASFCEIDLTTELLWRTKERCSIDFMREHDAKFDPRLTTQLRHPPTFIRNGQNGDRSALPERIKARLESDLSAIIDEMDGDGPPLRELLSV